ncbi:hypothetical protein BDR07DRAFT_1613934 [Suillus spraguei]|nr:hypothetical protein BDR07DRAFT_1613934 [Suillus spraguei]
MTMLNNNNPEAEDLALNDDWGPSFYNDGKGMKFSILFVPLQQFDPKRRKNAKPTTITKIVYIHEDMSMTDIGRSTHSQAANNGQGLGSSTGRARRTIDTHNLRIVAKGETRVYTKLVGNTKKEA